MKSRCSFWLMSLSASLALFVGQRLNAVGEIIALLLERSYPGEASQAAPSKRTRWKSPVALLRLATWPRRRGKLSGDPAQ